MVMLAWPSEQPKTTDKLQKTFCISDGRLQKNYKKTTDKLQSNWPAPRDLLHTHHRALFFFDDMYKISD